jgi:uncharacterized protein
MIVTAQSPCIRNCCLDDDDKCLGCFRSLQEIKEWGTADSHKRQIILQNAERRRESALDASDPAGLIRPAGCTIT